MSRVSPKAAPPPKAAVQPDKPAEKKPAAQTQATAAAEQKWTPPAANVQAKASQEAPPSKAAVKAASELHHAMVGGFTDAGTNEGKIFDTMFKCSKDELAEIKRAYALTFKDKAGKPADLSADLKGELNQTQFAVTEQLFKGNLPQAAALALKASKESSLDPTDSWPDAVDVLRPLADKPEALLETAREYLKLEGTPGEQKQANPGPAFLERLGSSLSYSDLSLASDWMVKAASTGGVHVGKLTQAQQVEASEANAAKKELTGVLSGGSEKAILDNLAQLKPSLRTWVLNDAGLMEKVGKELRGLKFDQAKALLGNDEVSAKAIEVRRAVLENPAAPALGVFAQVVGKGDPKAISEAFQAQTGSSLSTQNMSAADKALFTKLVSGAELTADENLKLDGSKLVAAIATKDFPAAKHALEGKTKAEVDKLTHLVEPTLRAYERFAVTGPASLHDHLENTFSGRDEFVLLEMLGKGKAQTKAQELEQEEDLARFEASPVADALQYATRNPGKVLGAPTSLRAARSLLNDAKAGFRTPDTEGGQLDQRLAAAKAGLGGKDEELLLSQAAAGNETYKTTKDEAGESVKSGIGHVATGVGIVAAPFTGGASLGLMAVGPGLGSVAKVAIKGSSMSSQELKAEALSATVATVAALAPTGPAGSAVANIAKAGLISAASEGVTEAAQSATWEDGVAKGLKRSGEKAGSGFVSGAGTAIAFEAGAGIAAGAKKALAGKPSATKAPAAAPKTMAFSQKSAPEPVVGRRTAPMETPASFPKETAAIVAARTRRQAVELSSTPKPVQSQLQKAGATTTMKQTIVNANGVEQTIYVGLKGRETVAFDASGKPVQYAGKLNTHSAREAAASAKKAGTPQQMVFDGVLVEVKPGSTLEQLRTQVATSLKSHPAAAKITAARSEAARANQAHANYAYELAARTKPGDPPKLDETFYKLSNEAVERTSRFMKEAGMPHDVVDVPRPKDSTIPEGTKMIVVRGDTGGGSGGRLNRIIGQMEKDTKMPGVGIVISPAEMPLQAGGIYESSADGKRLILDGNSVLNGRVDKLTLHELTHAWHDARSNANRPQLFNGDLHTDTPAPKRESGIRASEIPEVPRVLSAQGAGGIYSKYQSLDEVAAYSHTVLLDSRKVEDSIKQSPAGRLSDDAKFEILQFREKLKNGAMGVAEQSAEVLGNALNALEKGATATFGTPTVNGRPQTTATLLFDSPVRIDGTTKLVPITFNARLSGLPPNPTQAQLRSALKSHMEQQQVVAFKQAKTYDDMLQLTEPAKLSRERAEEAMELGRQQRQTVLDAEMKYRQQVGDAGPQKPAAGAREPSAKTTTPRAMFSSANTPTLAASVEGALNRKLSPHLRDRAIGELETIARAQGPEAPAALKALNDLSGRVGDGQDFLQYTQQATKVLAGIDTPAANKLTSDMFFAKVHDPKTNGVTNVPMLPVRANSQYAAINALAARGDANAMLILRDVVTHSNGSVRAEAIKALGRMSEEHFATGSYQLNGKGEYRNQSEHAAAEVRGLVSKGISGEDRALAIGLAAKQNPPPLRTIAGALNDADQSVQWAAIAALKKNFEDSEVKKALLDFARKTPDAALRNAAEGAARGQ
jgi:hypothetical protein